MVLENKKLHPVTSLWNVFFKGTIMTHIYKLHLTVLTNTRKQKESSNKSAILVLI
jgi:hypothetical protein